MEKISISAGRIWSPDDIAAVIGVVAKMAENSSTGHNSLDGFTDISINAEGLTMGIQQGKNKQDVNSLRGSIKGGITKSTKKKNLW
ncbi:MAG TPA: hypothetical protein VEB00_05615 [Clostridia bacterium]|nr:hypothetical protein [Clostridia bacterium]